jgi:hypothetical protein
MNQKSKFFARSSILHEDIQLKCSFVLVIYKLKLGFVMLELHIFSTELSRRLGDFVLLAIHPECLVSGEF